MQTTALIQFGFQFFIRRSYKIAALMVAMTCARDAIWGADAFDVEVSGQGSAVILVPGLGCSGEVWDEAVAELSKSHECHVLTLAGFAGNPKAEHEGKFIDFVANEANAYISENEIKDPVLIGHSLGGFIGMILASEEHSPLKGLIIVDSLPFLPAMMNPSATEESMKTMAKNMVQQSPSMDSPYFKQMLASMVTDSADIEKVYQWSLASDGETTGDAMYELYTTDLRDDVANIQIPVLVMGAWVGYKQYGSTRESTEAIYRNQFTSLPNYELKMTDVGRHFIMLDDPEFFIRETENYLKAI